MLYKYLTILLLVVCIQYSKSQTIKGVITDEKNLPIPYATIYIEDIQSGTTANVNGEYEVKVPTGNHSVLYKSLGYKEIKKQVEVSSTGLILNVSLLTEVYNLKEVSVSAKGEDAAYAIMRKAIALAPYHLREVKHYNSLVYLRGTIFIDKIPKLISKSVKIEENNKTVTLKSGDVYVEESILEIDFTAPSFYKRKVRSLRSTFPGDSNNPINPVVVIESSFYEPELIDMISPLAPQAFQHYKFKYLGFSEEGDVIIDKIQVIPRRKSQELFSGYIYIVEGKYCLHSIDLSVNQFWGSLNMKGVYGKVNNIAWLPVSYYFNAKASYLGVKGRYKYSSAVRYTKAVLNDKLTNMVKPSTVKAIEEAKPVVSKKKENVKQTVNKDKLTNRDMKKVSKEITEISVLQRTDTLTREKILAMTRRETDSLARKRDSTYWNEFRLVPLTAEEVKSFNEGPRGVLQKVKKDSVELAKDSTYVSKKKKNWHWPVTGKTFKSADNNVVFNYKGLIQPTNLHFNTVDGFRYGLSSDLLFKLDSGRRKINIVPWVGYAFNRKAFMWELHTEYTYYTNDGKRGFIKLNAGERSFDFNRESGITPFLNALHSLFLRENYMKLYNKKFIEASAFRSIKRYLTMNVGIQYAQTNQLENSTDFAFIGRNNSVYLPNLPPNNKYLSTIMDGGTDFRLSLGVELSPFRKPKGDGYNREYNPYPQISLLYTIGLPGVFSSNSEYQNIAISAYKRYWLGRNRVFKYKVHSTYWLSSKSVHFSDFGEVKTNYVPFDFKSFDYNYQLLPYYTFNTNQWNVGAHVQYQSKLLLLKRLPIISNRIWTENLYLNYLHTPNAKHYFEFGYTLGQVFAIAEAGVFTSITDFKYSTTGFKVSFDM